MYANQKDIIMKTETTTVKKDVTIMKVISLTFVLTITILTLVF